MGTEGDQQRLAKQRAIIQERPETAEDLEHQPAVFD